MLRLASPGLMALALAALTAPAAAAQTVSSEERFVDRFRTICLLDWPEASTEVLAGIQMVDVVSANALGRGFLADPALITDSDRVEAAILADFAAVKSDGLLNTHELRTFVGRSGKDQFFMCTLNARHVTPVALVAHISTRPDTQMQQDGAIVKIDMGDKTYLAPISQNDQLGMTLTRVSFIQSPAPSAQTTQE